MAYLSQQKGVTDMFGKITLPTARDGFTDDTGKVRIDGMYVFVNNENGAISNAFVKLNDNNTVSVTLSDGTNIDYANRITVILCADGLSGIKESIAAAYPNTEYQRCIVHQVRNTLKYVAEKDKKAFANDLKSIYHAPNEEIGCDRMQAVTKKWYDRYPNAMKRWEENWDVISPMFKFSADVRKVMYTTNATESLNSALRRLNSQRSVFPSDTALLKALYLATFEATKKWTMPLRNWGKVYGELSIMYDGRLF